MPKFHPLKIKEIRRETADCVSISFEIPPEWSEAYSFVPGQHLTLRARIDGEEVRRSYSICTSPAEHDLRVAVKKVDGGRFSTFANEKLKCGDMLEVMPPMGAFTPPELPATKNRYYVAFAAGSGITPVISILKTLLEEDAATIFTLFYANRRTDSIIFLDQLDALKSKYMERLSIHHILTGEDPGLELLHGRIDGQKCAALCTAFCDVKEVDGFFVCGPEEMSRGIRMALHEMGVDEGKVHYELFAAGAKQTKRKTKWKSSTGSVSSQITITLDGKTFSFNQSSADTAILDAAQNAGADLPYACKGGVCCTCKAKVLEGEVEMEVNYGLVPEQVESGYVLTCQSHPKSEKVVLSFDD